MNRLITKILVNAAAAIIISGSCLAQNEASIKNASGVEMGTEAYLWNATNQDGQDVNLKSELEKGPAVLIFYRGKWCPICTKHLSNLQDSLSYIREKNAQVFAISPEKQNRASETRKNTGADFDLIFDEGYVISDAYGVTFTPSDEEREMYNTHLDADLENAHSEGRTDLPVPATYIISQDGKIMWRQFDRDYKVRASVRDILEQL